MTTSPQKTAENIVVIRLGALGDIVLCFQAFHRIRQAHPGARITLVTMPAFEKFARMMPWFDDVITDSRPSFTDIGAWLELASKLRALKPMRVYDLQGKFRQTVLYTLLGGPLGTSLSWMEWSGAAPGCTFPRPWPPTPGSHFTSFISGQLDYTSIPRPETSFDIDWLVEPVTDINLPERYMLLIPGCSPGRDYKRWPAKNYAELANLLQERGIGAVAIGTAIESDVITEICAAAPHVINMCGRTSLPQLATLTRGSIGVVGNDTGPTHLVAAIGAPTLALFSGAVNPAWSAPQGPRAAWLQCASLVDLAVDDVMTALAPII